MNISRKNLTLSYIFPLTSLNEKQIIYLLMCSSNEGKNDYYLFLYIKLQIN